MAAPYIIQLHDIHLTDVWLQQKGGFIQQHGEDKVNIPSSADSDKDFMNHLLEVHTKFCIKPSCRHVIDSTTFKKDPNQFSHTNLVHESTSSQNVPVHAHNSESIKRENSLDDPSTHMEIQRIDYQQSAAVLSDTNSAIYPTPLHPCKFKIEQTIRADKTSNENKDTIYYGHHHHFMTEDAPESLSDESCETSVEESTDSHFEDLQGADPDNHMIHFKQETESPERSHDQESYMLVEVKSEQNVVSKGHVEDLQGADPDAHMIYIKQEPESPDRSHDLESYVLVDVISDENVEHPGKEHGHGQQLLLARVLENETEQLNIIKSQEKLVKKLDRDSLSQYNNFLKENEQLIFTGKCDSHMLEKVEEINSGKCKLNNVDNTTSARSSTGKSDKKPYTCQICSKGFTKKSHLQAHVRIHTGEKPYKCQICSKTFAQKSSLNVHLRTHTAEKPYKCPICSKAFTHKSALQIHWRTHTGEKPFKCKICSKTFIQKSHLQAHLSTHTAEKRYKCQICSYAFTQKSCLRVHLRTHTDEKPYKCKICFKTYAQKAHLERHERTHTGEKPFQ